MDNHVAQLRDQSQIWIRAAAIDLRHIVGRVPGRNIQFLIQNALVDRTGDVGRLPETHDFLEFASGLPLFWSRSAPPPPLDRTLRDLSRSLVLSSIAAFAANYVAATEEFGDGIEAFEAAYQNLEQYVFHYEDIAYTIIAELWNIQADRLPVQLDATSVIRPLTTAEQEASRAATAKTARATPYAIAPLPEMVAEKHGTIGEIERDSEVKLLLYGWTSRAPIQAFSDQLLLALRLQKEGLIWTGFGTLAIHHPYFPNDRSVDLTNENAWFRSRTAADYPEWPRMEPTESFRLTDEIADRLSAIWPYLSSASEHNDLRLPIRRYRTSFDRSTLEDRFIDQWIALDGLFGSEGSRATERMVTRLSNFLGGEAAAIQEVHDTARDSYRTRSDIVHGRGYDQANLREQRALTEDYLRRTLVKSIEIHQQPNLKQRLFGQ